MEAQTIGRTHRRVVMIEVVVFLERQSGPKYIRIYMEVTSWLLYRQFYFLNGVILVVQLRSLASSGMLCLVRW